MSEYYTHTYEQITDPIAAVDDAKDFGVRNRILPPNSASTITIVGTDRIVSAYLHTPASSVKTDAIQHAPLLPEQFDVQRYVRPTGDEIQLVDGDKSIPLIDCISSYPSPSLFNEFSSQLGHHSREDTARLVVSNVSVGSPQGVAELLKRGDHPFTLSSGLIEFSWMRAIGSVVMDPEYFRNAVHAVRQTDSVEAQKLVARNFTTAARLMYMYAVDFEKGQSLLARSFSHGIEGIVDFSKGPAYHAPLLRNFITAKSIEKHFTTLGPQSQRRNA